MILLASSLLMLLPRKWRDIKSSLSSSTASIARPPADGDGGGLAASPARSTSMAADTVTSVAASSSASLQAKAGGAAGAGRGACRRRLLSSARRAMRARRCRTSERARASRCHATGAGGNALRWWAAGAVGDGTAAGSCGGVTDLALSEKDWTGLGRAWVAGEGSAEEAPTGRIRRAASHSPRRNWGWLTIRTRYCGSIFVSNPHATSISWNCSIVGAGPSR
mmetsp:Transcript_1742/g.4199  ORF Transcript_1742/g.4199 Transcript_1742/m.4199 type:complete len:222 (-) Transcript_1742:571-1236(-)